MTRWWSGAANSAARHGQGTGRDHHIKGFTMFVAGGGVQAASNSAAQMTWATTPSKT